MRKMDETPDDHCGFSVAGRFLRLIGIIAGGPLEATARPLAPEIAKLVRIYVANAIKERMHELVAATVHQNLDHNTAARRERHAQRLAPVWLKRLWNDKNISEPAPRRSEALIRRKRR